MYVKVKPVVFIIVTPKCITNTLIKLSKKKKDKEPLISGAYRDRILTILK